MIELTTQIKDLIAQEPQAASILAESGMQCAGCILSGNETIEQAAREHHQDPVLLVRKLNFRLYGKI